MVYATYSEGFRPGGFNRGQGALSPSSPLYGTGFQIPLYYGSDTLKNKEIGWKTNWLDHHLQLDGALYQEDWLNVQLPRSSILRCTATRSSLRPTGRIHRVRGLEGHMVYNATEACERSLILRVELELAAERPPRS